jgi:hypothetical protein
MWKIGQMFYLMVYNQVFKHWNLTYKFMDLFGILMLHIDAGKITCLLFVIYNFVMKHDVTICSQH